MITTQNSPIISRRRINQCLSGALVGMVAPNLAMADLKQRTQFDRPDQSFLLVEYRDSLPNGVAIAFIRQGKALIAQRNGTIKIFSGNKIENSKIFGMPPINNFGLGGLLDFKIAPESINQAGLDNIIVYFSYTKTVGQAVEIVLMRGKISLKDTKISDLEVIYQTDLKLITFINNGGGIAFDENGNIFFAIGDRGGASAAQDDKTPAGKILHLTREGKAVKNTNPNGLPEIYAKGFLNPSQLQYQAPNLLVFDQYPDGGDEINLIIVGGNYGWPIISSKPSNDFDITGKKLTPKTPTINAINPIAFWESNAGVNCMLMIKGDKGFRKFKNWFFIATRKTQQLVAVSVQNGKIAEERILLDKQIGEIISITEAPDGLIYILTNGELNNLFRLEPAN